MFGGKKPDATGIYRALKRMEEAELVTSVWDTPEEGSAKRLFSLTDKGRRCLRRWIDALACYELTLEELRGLAAGALGIDLLTPPCARIRHCAPFEPKAFSVPKSCPFTPRFLGHPTKLRMARKAGGYSEGPSLRTLKALNHRPCQPLSSQQPS